MNSGTCSHVHTVCKTWKAQPTDARKSLTCFGVSFCRCSSSDIQEAVESFDPVVFETNEDVVAVMNCVPTAEEQGLLESYLAGGGDFDSLTSEEQYAVQLMRVWPLLL